MLPFQGALRETCRLASSSKVLLIIAVVAIALNLRPALATIGPVLDRIEATTGLTSVGAGLLTTLPVFLMGLGALAGSSMQRWIGEGRGIAFGVATIALACIARLFWFSIAGLLASAAACGLGIAAVQALMPGFIKRVFPSDARRAWDCTQPPSWEAQRSQPRQRLDCPVS